MTKKKAILVGRISGRGQVLKDNIVIADVAYTIEVLQDIVEVSTLGGKEQLEGQKDLRGQIKVLRGERDLSDGSLLTLRLEDARRWTFFAKSGDPVSGVYIVVNASGEGLVWAPPE